MAGLQEMSLGGLHGCFTSQLIIHFAHMLWHNASSSMCQLGHPMLLFAHPPLEHLVILSVSPGGSLPWDLCWGGFWSSGGASLMSCRLLHYLSCSASTPRSGAPKGTRSRDTHLVAEGMLCISRGTLEIQKAKKSRGATKAKLWCKPQFRPWILTPISTS